MENAIFIKDLKKEYFDQLKGINITALNSLDLAIPKGSIFGLLGPNGAGKSTLINILAGTVVKKSGEVKILDTCIDKEPKGAKKLLGIVPQEISYDSFFSLHQGLEFYAGYYGIKKQDRKTDEILKALGLWNKREAKPQQLSGGMKRRFLIAKAMVHSPKVLILDEPTAGVDLELRNQLWDYVRKLNKEEGVTVIITTHYLDEAEQMCDEIAFINKGKIIHQDKKQNLMKKVDCNYIDVSFKEKVMLSMFKLDSDSMCLIEDNQVRFQIDSGNNSYKNVMKELGAVRAEVADIKVFQPKLEDIFYNIMQK